jgi:pyruvate/2-oxoglutarate dehydrogenase complex dihydrolipoamide dehydrogenase (E3) component
VDYSKLPWCTFTDPQVAHVGHNETSAQAASIEYEVTRYDLAGLDRAIAESARSGVVKVLTVPGKDTILGATIVGEAAGELIIEFVSAMKHGIGLNKILATIHPYPTLAEANRFAASEWKKAHAPEWVFPWLARFHTWRR